MFYCSIVQLIDRIPTLRLTINVSLRWDQFDLPNHRFGTCLATSAVLFHIMNQISLVKIKSRRAAEDYSRTGYRIR